MSTTNAEPTSTLLLYVTPVADGFVYLAAALAHRGTIAYRSSPNRAKGDPSIVDSRSELARDSDVQATFLPTDPCKYWHLASNTPIKTQLLNGEADAHPASRTVSKQRLPNPRRG